MKTAQAPWRQDVQREASFLGYQNWIVIAEASYPAKYHKGLRQISVPVDAPEALDAVFEALSQTQHVQPRIYMARELRYVENNYAPGVDALRKKIEQGLAGREVTEMDNKAISVLLDSASDKYNVLVVRTTTALPYSSVFLELQPGYWDGESEAHLRERMKEKQNPLQAPAPQQPANSAP